MNEITYEFIREHQNDDVRKLAFQGSKFPEVDLPFALDQIAGRQKAKSKLPSWYDIEGIIYPPHISMEQCSSEKTAEYKAALASRLGGTRMADLTGGFGVDFSYMAKMFREATYVERQEHLCNNAIHNMPLLGLNNVKVVNGDGVEYLHHMDRVDLLFMDPARRDTAGGKVFGIEDCTPNVLAVLDELLVKSGHLVLKLSPMLDVRAAVESLGRGNVKEVHVVSVDNECKELLIVLCKGADNVIQVSCVNNDDVFSYPYEGEETRPVCLSGFDIQGKFLYVPNASVMKMGCFGYLTSKYPVKAVSLNSHLFVADSKIDCFPGRRFSIESVMTLNKKEIRQKLGDISKANVSVRNFPLKAEALKKRLKFADGGDVYLFGTTVNDLQKGDVHILLRCVKC